VPPLGNPKQKPEIDTMPQTSKTISDFPESTAPAATDQILIETTPAAYKKATVSTLRNQMFGVRYDAAQSLNNSQVSQALANLGITLTNDGLQVLCPDGETRLVPFLN
jgi:hypothetical protein